MSQDCNMSEMEIPEDGRNKDKTNQKFLGKFSSVSEYTQTGLQLLMNNIKTSSKLPSMQKWDYYTTFPSFKRIMNGEGNNALQLISLIMQHQGVNGNILKRDFDEKFELLVEANDMIFERVSNTLDELSGIKRNPEPVLVQASGPTRAIKGSWNKNFNNIRNDGSHQTEPKAVRLLAAQNIQRPQLKFQNKIDNTNTPWEPTIKDKPNSLKPLAITVVYDEDEAIYSHPYEYELDRFSPQEWQLKPFESSSSPPVESTPLVMVESSEALNLLLDDLRKCDMFAVDLEHHSYRSFQGFTCLMQISTQEKDYLIDTLELRSHLHILNEVFTKPSILKIFHGADSDIKWLQRDFNLYVVNMFDTHQAAKALDFAGLSLGFLLKHYCKMDANKHFQLADWRIRPLPQELKDYARDDTHYLIHIFKLMSNALLEKANGKTNLLEAVYQRSTNLCRLQYTKPLLQNDSYMTLYEKSRKMFNNRQKHALENLFNWRDKTARIEDESLGYVLPNHMLLHICELLPREIQGILACCNPIPPLVRQNLVEIHQMILKARDQPLVKPVVEEEMRQRPIAAAWAKFNLEGHLNCPHDLSNQKDFRDDLPTLLNIDFTAGNETTDSEFSNSNSFLPPLSTSEQVSSLIETASQISFITSKFSKKTSIDTEELKQIKERLTLVQFKSPYERYKEARPYLDQLRAKELKEYEKQKQALENENKQRQELTNEERIQRMKEDIARDAAGPSKLSTQAQSSTSGNSKAAGSAPKEIRNERFENLINQPSASKRKVPALKNTSFNEDEFEVESKNQSKKIKTDPGNGEIKNKNSSESAGNKSNYQQPPKNQSDQPYNFKEADYNRFQGGSRQNVPNKFPWNPQNNEKKYKRDIKALGGGVYINKKNKRPRGRGRGRF